MNQPQILAGAIEPNGSGVSGPVERNMADPAGSQGPLPRLPNCTASPQRPGTVGEAIGGRPVFAVLEPVNKQLFERF